jgi:hypothetical protein
MPTGSWQRMLEKLKRIFRRREPEQPPNPYAYVTAPRKPRPSSRSVAAVAELHE